MPMVLIHTTRWSLDICLNRCWQLDGCSPQSSEKTTNVSELAVFFIDKFPLPTFFKTACEIVCRRQLQNV
jgi:hypothetical protein